MSVPPYEENTRGSRTIPHEELIPQSLVDRLTPERQRGSQRLLDAGLVGILYWTIEGGIVDANDTLLEMLGYTREDLQAGRIDWIEMTPPELRERDAQPVADLHATGRHLPFEKEYIRKDGTRVPVLVASAFHEGSRTEGVGFVVDITAQKKAQEEANQRSQEIATIFESMTDAFFALDRDWKFTYVNPESGRLMHRNRDELIGKSFWDEFPEAVDSAFGREYRRAVAEGVPVTVEDFYPPLDAWFEVRAYPARPDSDSGVGLSVYFRNVTKRKRGEQERDAALAAIKETQERLHLALASGGMGTWDIDLVTGAMTLSEEIPPLYGRPRAAITISVTEWSETWLHPDDRERIPEAFAAALRGETEYNVQFRTIWPDGKSYRWIATSALITRDAGGQAVRAVGYTRDVTREREQKEEQEALLLRQRQFMQDMIYSLTEGKFILCLSDSDLPASLRSASRMMTLSVPTLGIFRKRLNAITEEILLDKERAQDIETGVGEAAMNTATHGGGGEGWICADSESGTVQVWVRDSGGGISDEALPKVLEKGVSTAGTLGHGFWLMLRTCDRIYLLTGPGGTTVVLEQERTPPQPAWLKSVMA